MKFSSISNIGKIREVNEDSYSNLSVENYDFFIVADGMGGHSDGELASSLASKSFVDFIASAKKEDYLNAVDLQNAAIIHANEEVYKLSKEKNEKMGTTVVCLCLDHQHKLYHLSHVGDSRAYLYRDDDLRQITKDHSLLNELIDNGAINEDEAAGFANKNAITRAVGIAATVKPSSKTFDMKDDDLLLIVTDGLSNEISTEEIIDIIRTNDDVYDISTKLVDAAIAAGGRDNITVTTIRM